MHMLYIITPMADIQFIVRGDKLEKRVYMVYDLCTASYDCI